MFTLEGRELVSVNNIVFIDGGRKRYKLIRNIIIKNIINISLGFYYYICKK